MTLQLASAVTEISDTLMVFGGEMGGGSDEAWRWTGNVLLTVLSGNR